MIEPLDDVERGESLVSKAAELLSDKGLSDGLTWLMMDDGFQLRRLFEGSDQFRINRSKRYSDFPGCKHVYRFTYKGKFYEMFCEKEKEGWAIDNGWVNNGVFRMMIDGELALEAEYLDTIYFLEYGTNLLEISLSKPSLKTVKMGEWLVDLPELAGLGQAKESEWKDEMRREYAEEEAKERIEKIDLGDYE